MEDKNKYTSAFEKLMNNSKPFLAAVVANQLRSLDKAKDFLKKIEWMYDSSHDIEACNVCDRFQKDGHKPDCELKALLDELEGK